MVRTKRGATVMIETSPRVKGWRGAVADAARLAVNAAGAKQFAGDVCVDVTFRWIKPKSHARLRAGEAPGTPRRADIDKLSRAILDALTGVVYDDDRQVAMLTARRVWADGEGADITVSAM
jgi:crossover junction endodeoxyribonuclease RusA